MDLALPLDGSHPSLRAVFSFPGNVVSALHPPSRLAVQGESVWTRMLEQYRNRRKASLPATSAFSGLFQKNSRSRPGAGNLPRNSFRESAYDALSSWTSSTTAMACSTDVCCRIPCPRLKMCPGRPPASRRTRRTSVSRCLRLPSSAQGSRLP